MKRNSFEKGKIIFQVLLILSFRWTTTNCQLNLYNTDRTTKSNALQYDCLDYHVSRKKMAYQEFFDVVNEVIPYCFRPENPFGEELERFVHPLSQKLSFEEVHLANITSQQLLSWPVPIEVSQRYQFYLNKSNAAPNE
jgi:hypothetical protein